MEWDEFKERLLGMAGSLLTSRKFWMAALAGYLAHINGHTELIPVIGLGLMAGITLEDMAEKFGIPWPGSDGKESE